jgi:hypothetical protein
VTDFMREGLGAPNVDGFFKGNEVTRTNGRPTYQWFRLEAGRSDDLGATRR